MRVSRYLAIFFAFTVVLAYQNCSQVFFSPAQNLDSKNSSQLLMGGGNGEPYEGKPEGYYVRTIPGWSCEDEFTDVYASLNVSTETSAALITNPKDKCGLRKPDVPISKIDVFPTSTDVVAFKEGIYQRTNNASNEGTQFGSVETWCRDWDKNERWDILMYKSGSSFKAAFVRGIKDGSEWKLHGFNTDSVTQSQLGSQLVYRHSSLKLSVEMAQDSKSSVLQYDGQLEVTLDNQKTNRNMSCRTGKRYDPVVNKTYCDIRVSQTPYANSGEALIDGTTPEKAFTICSAEQLNNIGLNSTDWDKYFTIKGDIDMSSLGATSYNVIGTSSAPFTGQLDGLDFQISHLTFSDTLKDNIGLIGRAQNVTVKNISLNNMSITGRNSVGGAIGFVNGGQVTAVRVNGNVSGTGFIGGTVGQALGVLTMNYCHNSIDISSTGDHSGGIVGYAFSGLLSNSTAKGLIYAGDRSGGLAGTVGNGFTIEDSSAQVDILPNLSFTMSAGGLVGENMGQIRRSFSTGNVQTIGGGAAGGLIGNNSGDVENVYSTGHVQGSSLVGGLIGVQGGSSSQIQSCYATGNVTASSGEAGGLVGGTVVSGANISDCFARGDVSGSSVGAEVGPLVGRFSGTITNSFFDAASLCTNSLASCNSVGSPVDTIADPNHFYNPSSAPLNAWDFLNVWIAPLNEHPRLINTLE